MISVDVFGGVVQACRDALTNKVLNLENAFCLLLASRHSENWALTSDFLYNGSVGPVVYAVMGVNILGASPLYENPVTIIRQGKPCTCRRQRHPRKGPTELAPGHGPSIIWNRPVAASMPGVWWELCRKMHSAIHTMGFYSLCFIANRTQS
jgi:hypothetical protein